MRVVAMGIRAGSEMEFFPECLGTDPVLLAVCTSVWRHKLGTCVPNLGRRTLLISGFPACRIMSASFLLQFSSALRQLVE